MERHLWRTGSGVVRNIYVSKRLSASAVLSVQRRKSQSPSLPLSLFGKIILVPFVRFVKGMSKRGVSGIFWRDYFATF